MFSNFSDISSTYILDILNYLLILKTDGHILFGFVSSTSGFPLGFFLKADESFYFKNSNVVVLVPLEFKGDIS